MSISTTATKVSYAGNNSTSTPYPISFKYLDEAHVTVYADKVDITAECTFSGDGAAGTGQFTTDPAQAAGVTVTAVLDVPFDQPVVLQETGSLPAKTLEVSGFDRLNMQIRRVWRGVQDTLRFSSDEGGGSTGTADTLVGFNGDGDIEQVAKSAFVQAANNLSDVDAATARTNLNVDVAGTDNSTDVSLAGSGTYISLGAGQVLTVDPIEGTEVASTGETSASKFLRENGDGTCSWQAITGGGDALTSSPLSQFASTTSAQLAGVISDETGTGSVVFANSPTLVTPNLGTPSAVDLANATNIPLPAAGTVTEAMLEASVQTSLGLADTAIQVETNGTTQGEGATTYNIQPKDEGTVAGNARGENSIDLQTSRTVATQVASGAGAIILGGLSNSATGTRSTVISGTSNSSSGNNAVVSGGFDNTATGNQSGVYSGSDNTASGEGSLVAGGQQGTASHAGAKVFADSTVTAFSSIANDEFAIQGSALRLVDGNQAAGKVLTCDANGSGNWADAATGLSFASYSIVAGSLSSSGVLNITESLDPDGIATVSSGVVTLGAGTYMITHYGEYREEDNDATDYWVVNTRHNGASQTNFVVDETYPSANEYNSYNATFIVTSGASQTVDIYVVDNGGLGDVFHHRNVKLSILKLA